MQPTSLKKNTFPALRKTWLSHLPTKSKQGSIRPLASSTADWIDGFDRDGRRRS